VGLGAWCDVHGYKRMDTIYDKRIEITGLGAWYVAPGPGLIDYVRRTWCAYACGANRTLIFLFRRRRTSH
jgi:hypothetical protein